VCRVVPPGSTGPDAWLLQLVAFANDPDNLLAVSAHANEDKSDSGPGEWLAPNEAFDCSRDHLLESGYEIPTSDYNQ